MLDTIKCFTDVFDFFSSILEAIATFASFLFNIVTSIPSYISTLIDFIRVYVIELPITLVTMFGVLPSFVQVGLIVLLYAIYISFIFRLINLFIPLY